VSRFSLGGLSSRAMRESGALCRAEFVLRPGFFDFLSLRIFPFSPFLSLGG